MKVEISNKFLKWQEDNKYNTDVMKDINDLLVQAYFVTEPAQIIPQPKTVGKTLGKNGGTVWEFTLGQYRLYAKCGNFESGVKTFRVAIVGIKAKKSDQNDDIYNAKSMFKKDSNTKWTEWTPTKEQRQEWEERQAKSVEKMETVKNVDEPKQKEPKQKIDRKPRDENGLTRAERKIQNRKLREEQRNKEEAERKNKMLKKDAELEAEIERETRDVKEFEEAVATLKNQLHLASGDKAKVVNAWIGVNVAAIEVGRVDIELKKMQLGGKSVSGAKGIIDAISAFQDKFTRIKRTFIAIFTGTGGNQGAALNGAKSINDAMKKIKEMFIKLQSANTAKSKKTAQTAEPKAPVEKVSMDDLEAGITLIVPEKDDVVAAPVDVKADKKVDVAPVEKPVAAPAAAEKAPVSQDEKANDNVVADINVKQVTLNDEPQAKPDMPSDNVEFKDYDGVQYRLEQIEHQINIENSKIEIAKQNIAIERAKIAKEILELEKLELLMAQKKHNM